MTSDRVLRKIEGIRRDAKVLVQGIQSRRRRRCRCYKNRLKGIKKKREGKIGKKKKEPKVNSRGSRIPCIYKTIPVFLDGYESNKDT